MPGLLAIVGEGIDFGRLALKFEALSPLVIDSKTAPGAYHVVRFTNAKFLADKVFQEDADLMVALDGVIFNLDRLQQEYKTSDCFETIKAMYRRQGPDMVRSLRGEFAAVIYDKPGRRWLVFTNHTASKPVFYHHSPGLLVVSTDFMAMTQALRALGRKLSLDQFGAYCMLTYAYMLEDYTLVAEVKKLKPGHRLTYDGSVARVEEYVRFRNAPYLTDSKADIIERIDALFTAAVRSQYDKDRRYGYDHLATLSGGLDSRTNLVVAHELGYRPQTAMTFSQTGYLDARIAGKVASDLGVEFVFYSLDNGHYLAPSFRDAVRANGGLVLFVGSAHLLSALRRIDTVRSGMLHTGMIGDAVLGSFLKSVKPMKAQVSFGAYCPFLLDRVAGQVQKIIDQYETEDEFLMYSRAFNGALNGNWTTYQFTECTSPFLDWDMLEYAMHIPRSMRLHEQIYLDWVLAKHPVVGRYMWEKTKAMPGDSPVLAKIKKALWVVGVLGRWRWDLVSMNPLKHWYNENPALREFVENYWRDNSAVLDDYPELKRDCQAMFNEATTWRRGPLISKAQVMTLVEAVRMHLG